MPKNFITSVLTNKCPRCREGKLFVSNNPYDFSKMTTMNENCPVCGQPTEIEVGFYIGTGYVSYALMVAYFVSTFVAWKVLIGMTFDLDDNRIFYWMFGSIGLVVLLQPIFMRLSRSIWIAMFVSYHKNWKDDPLEYNERMDEKMKEK
jgi:rRNA maturation protein Nop10